MNTMQEALTEALEHPITEIKRKGQQAMRMTGGSADTRFWWGVFGYLAASALLYRMYRGATR